MKKALAVLAVITLLGTVSQAAIVTLTITSPSPGTWQAWARASSDCKGLSTFIINVTADSGLAVGTSTCKVPKYYNVEIEDQAGFKKFRENGTAGIGICAGQDTIYGAQNNPAYDALVIQDVGIVAGSYGSTSWSVPVLLASGTYTGTVGFLHVRVGNGQINVLRNVGSWYGPGNVDQAQVIVGDLYIPEPATLLLVLGGVAGLVIRRRR